MELQECGASNNINELHSIAPSSNTIDNQEKSVRKRFKTNHYPNKEIISVKSNVQQSFTPSSNTIDNQEKSVRKRFKTNHYPNKEIISVKSNVQQSFTPSSNTIDNQEKSVRKRFKTNHYPNKEIISVKSNVQQSFKKAQINQNSDGQLINFDIENPIFKLPFEHGWKREVVFRKSIDSSGISKQPLADVYYLTPTNKKLRSVVELKRYLCQSNVKDNLTISNFSFYKRATGIDDQSKEIIREAHNKSLKVNLRPNNKLKKQLEISKNLNLKESTSKNQPNIHSSMTSSTSCTSTSTYKNQQIIHSSTTSSTSSTSTSTSKNQQIIHSSTTSSTSSTSTSTSKNQQIIHSSTTSSTSSTSTSQTAKENIINNIIRNLEINNSLRNESEPEMNINYSFEKMVQALFLIFQKLNVRQLSTASEVCKVWNVVANNDALWKKICLRNLKVCNWEKCISLINRKRSFVLDTSHMVIPEQIIDNSIFWLKFYMAIKNAKHIKTIILHECPIYVAKDIIYSLPQLEVFKATINIKNQSYYQMDDSITLVCLERMTQLTEIRIKGPVSGMKLMQTPSLSNLTNLKILSLTSIYSFPKDICSSLLDLKNHLEVLKIGNCDSLPEEFSSVIEKLEKLKSLRLENCNGKWNYFSKYYFREIRRLKNLRTLELINIKFNNSIEAELINCDHIKALLIIPDYRNQSSAINLHLFHKLKDLSKSLSHLVWGITNESLDDYTDLFNCYIENLYKNCILLSRANTDFNNVPEGNPIVQPEDTTLETNGEIPSHDFNLLRVKSFEDLLKKNFASVKSKLINIPFSATTEVYLANEFIDIDWIK